MKSRLVHLINEPRRKMQRMSQFSVVSYQVFTRCSLNPGRYSPIVFTSRFLINFSLYTFSHFYYYYFRIMEN
jgi:hypothetical protein